MTQDNMWAYAIQGFAYLHVSKPFLFMYMESYAQINTSVDRFWAVLLYGHLQGQQWPLYDRSNTGESPDHFSQKKPTACCLYHDVFTASPSLLMQMSLVSLPHEDGAHISICR